MSMTCGVARMQFADSITKTVGRLGLALLLVASAVAARGEIRWHTDYAAALTASEENGRPVLTVFTGSDWCQHCRVLERQVLETPEFQAWAESRVELLMIDLPQAGISLDERKARSRVCIKYGVRSFPSVVILAPDGSKITSQSGYHGQTATTWLAALDSHVPPPAVVDAGRVHSSLGEAVATARSAKRPVLVMVSRSGDSGATTRLASLMRDPEFESLARENFVVAQVPSAEGAAATPEEAAVGELLGGEELPPETVEIVVTDDGHTPLYAESADQTPDRVVSGLRRFLANRQASRATRR
jgi:thiol-disulfide isomerase/thioredoxin